MSYIRQVVGVNKGIRMLGVGGFGGVGWEEKIQSEWWKGPE